MFSRQVFDEAYALAADPKRDDAISNRLRSLSFLTEEHLGVPPLVDTEVLYVCVPLSQVAAYL